MKNYLFTIIGTVLVSAIITVLIADGKTSSIIRNITRLVCVLVIISPIFNSIYVKNPDTFLWEEKSDYFSENVIEAHTNFIQYYSELRIENAEKLLEEELFNKFKVKINTDIHWEFNEENALDIYAKNNIKILRINISVSGTISEEVKKSMCEYVANTYCSEVKIE